jgi:ATP-dependent Lon protease
MSENQDLDHIEIPKELPVLPVKDVVSFPSVILPLFVGRDSSIAAVNSLRLKKIV